MFGLINPIDLLGLLVLLVMALKLLTAWVAGPVSLQSRQLTLELVAQEVAPYLAQNIQVGQELRQDGDEYSLGTIQRKRVAPSEYQVGPDGRATFSSSSRRLDLWLQVGPVRSQLVKGSDRSGFYLGKLPLRVGQRLMLHTTTASLTGEVEAIRVVRDGSR